MLMAILIRHYHYKMSSSQALLRVGEKMDIYYTDDANCKKQSIPVEYDTRYRQDFSNKSAGVSVLTIPPNQGVRHCLIVLGYSAASINTQTGSRCLERGWGYKAIEQVSFRIGGSSQYFLTGDQLLARNIRLCRTQSQRDALLQLGGNECKVAADFDVDQYAYIPVSIWCAPGEDELQLPLPTDLLVQQTQLTAQLVPAPSFWSAAIGGFAGGDVAPPSGFDTAYFQIEQLCMLDRGMGLANRVDMNSHMYSMPLPTFDQQEVLLQVNSAAAPQSVVLTGFRAGEVKKLQIYLTKNNPSAAGTAEAASDNALRWYAPASVKVLYAGLVYANYEAGSSRIWNLLDGTAPAAVNQSALSVAGGVWTSTPVLSEWCELPFGQPSGSDYEADILTHGKQITNGLVNMELIVPAGGGADGWTLHIIYVYNSTLVFSRGTAELTF
jgi:hypothetical protein